MVPAGLVILGVDSLVGSIRDGATSCNIEAADLPVPDSGEVTLGVCENDGPSANIVRLALPHREPPIESLADAAFLRCQADGDRPGFTIKLHFLAGETRSLYTNDPEKSQTTLNEANDLNVQFAPQQLSTIEVVKAAGATSQPDGWIASCQTDDGVQLNIFWPN